MSASSHKAKLQERDARLAERFDYWYNERRLRLDDTYKKLEDEFYISVRHVVVILARRKKEAEPQPKQGDLFRD